MFLERLTFGFLLNEIRGPLLLAVLFALLAAVHPEHRLGWAIVSGSWLAGAAFIAAEWWSTRRRFVLLLEAQRTIERAHAARRPTWPK